MRARVCAEGGRKGGKRKTRAQREASNALLPALRGSRILRILVSELWPETLQPGSQWSLESKSVSWFPLSPTREWLPGAQAERHQLAVTLPQILQMEFLRSTAGLCGGASEMQDLGL